MAGPTSRGKLRKTGCSSKKLIIPRVQMYFTDKVGRKETQGDRTTALHIFGRHTKTCILEESKLRMTSQNKATKQKQLRILIASQIRKYQDEGSNIR